MRCPPLGFTYLLPSLITCHSVSVNSHPVYPFSPTSSCPVCMTEPAATQYTVSLKFDNIFEKLTLLFATMAMLYHTRPSPIHAYSVLHTKRQELSYFDILWIFSYNELGTHETYHHDPQPLPVNFITIT